jgi:hypothetical protein
MVKTKCLEQFPKHKLKNNKFDFKLWRFNKKFKRPTSKVESRFYMCNKVQMHAMLFRQNVFEIPSVSNLF